MSNSSRLFFALWPDDETRQALICLAQSISATDFKWVQPHNLHVTLVFLGQIDSETALLIKQSVVDFTSQPFALTFDRLSYWSKPKILCLTCRQPAQEAAILAAKLATAATNCGLQTETRPYTPHITLTRHARYLPDVKIEPIVWRAEAFCLVESCSEPDGVCYKVVQQWPFIQSPANPE